MVRYCENGSPKSKELKYFYLSEHRVDWLKENRMSMLWYIDNFDLTLND